MKKSMLVLLAASSLLLVGCSKTEETKTSTSSTSSSSSSSQSSSTSSSQVTSNSKAAPSVFDLEAIKAGDFSSIYGTWKNNAGDSITFPNSNALSLSGTENDGIPGLEMRGESPTSGVAVVLYPIGLEISDATDPSFQDQSDTTKDRLVISNGGLTTEQTATEVYYRQ